MVNPNKAYVLGPRGNGKTFSIGDRIERLSEVMPRSQILLLSDTYDRLMEKIVPNIADYFINHAGMVENEDFILFKKPPEHFKSPIIPLTDFEHVISFRDGMALCLVSGHKEGSANAFNAQSMIVDEAKFVKPEHVKQAALVLRGENKRFGHLPEYRSQWFFSDKYPVRGSNIKWLLNKKRIAADEAVIDAIVTLQLQVYQLEQKINNATSEATKYYYNCQKEKIEAWLNKVRMDLIFYCDGIPYENIDNLGIRYYRDQKRELTDYEYRIAILNEDPDSVENAFYPALNKQQHYYSLTNDIDTYRPLAIALDYNWRIVPMVVGQAGILPGNEVSTFNIVAGLHTLRDGGIVETCKAFDKQFGAHQCKTVQFCYDQTAIGKSPAGKAFYQIVIDTLTSLGWNVMQAYIGPATEHDSRHETFKNYMARTDEGSLRINQSRCEFLLLSMQQAGAITVNGKTKKDKSKEKKDNYPPEEATDYSEAFDMLLIAWLKKKLYFNAESKHGTGLAFR
jgi:hypothetical protein